MKKLLFICFAALGMAGCKTKNTEPGIPVEVRAEKEAWKIIKQEQTGGRVKAGNELITSQEALTKLYSELNLTDVPVIDFKNKNVVALFFGEKRTGGYSISVEDVVVENYRAEVKILKGYPEAGGMVTMMITSPYCIAVITKAKETVFVQDPPPAK